MRWTYILVCLVALPACETSQKRAPWPAYRDKTLTIDERVDDLMARMTLEEKISQLWCHWPFASNESNRGKGILDKSGDFDPDGARKLLYRGIGQLGRPNEAKDITEGARFINDIQDFLIENSRLGIPAMFHEEGLHGHMAPGGTCYPQAIGLSCTWDVDLVERIFTATAREMRARGVHQALTPVLDVCRDPRWGRTEETYGEDPYLVARLGVACIQGFQGRGARVDQMLPTDRVCATAKHFAVHGQPEGGMNCAPGNFSETKIRQVFLPPFEAAIREAKALSVMASYNEVDGVPLHGHKKLMVDVLRDEWGFDGFVVSDYYGIEQMKTLHHSVANLDEAGRQALAVSVDIELPDPAGYKNLAKMVRDGTVPLSHIDRSVRRMLRAKFQSGVMDDPFVDSERAKRLANCTAHQKLALEAARKVIVLLENRKETLPLDDNKVKTIGVIGPNADRLLFGGYSDPIGPGRGVTMLQGIRKRAGDKVKVLHAEGCRITPERADWFTNKIELTKAKDDEPRIEEALEIARQADVNVLVLGGNDATCREGWSEGHLGDRDSLDLLGRQQELFDKVHALGKPVVVVLIGGRPFTIEKISEKAHALLHGWYLGQEGGTALAEVLFGDVNPSGKLSITFPRSVGQIPANYGHKPSARRGYLFADKAPLYPFGHGRSYTTFEYGKPELTETVIRVGETAVVSVTVKNSGKRRGTEIVQCYIRDLVSTVTRPVLELRGFERVTLEPGKEQTVRFRLEPKHLAALGLDSRWRVEPGQFEVHVGRSSADLAKVRLTVR